MCQPLSLDLRSRALLAVDGGMSCRAATPRFGLAPSTVIRWNATRRPRGGYAPKAQGGDMRSHRIEAHAAFMLGLLEEQAI